MDAVEIDRITLLDAVMCVSYIFYFPRLKLVPLYGLIWPCTAYGVVRRTYTDSVWLIKRMKIIKHRNGMKTEEFDFFSVFEVCKNRTPKNEEKYIVCVWFSGSKVAPEGCTNKIVKITPYTRTRKNKTVVCLTG